MTYRKIIDQFPGYTIYQGESPGQVYHCFSDTYCCSTTGTSTEIHGKGALSHRVSAFLFSKLAQLSIPNHFLGTRNMRESLLQATNPLPFSLRIHNRASLALSNAFYVPEDTVFDPPLIEYITPSTQYHANDDFLMAMGWVDQDEIDELQALALRTTHCLQGIFVAFDLSLIEVQLNLARSFEETFLVAGPLSPEQFLLRDLRTGAIWSIEPTEDAAGCPLTPYLLLAQRLGLYPDSQEIPTESEAPCDQAGPDNANQPGISEKTRPEEATNNKTKSELGKAHWPKNVVPFPKIILNPLAN